MVQSVELVLDAALDAQVRREWEALRAADLPSQARHTGESNAPHVTLAVADALDDDAESALAAVTGAAGLPVRLGGLLVFTGRTAVVSRVVVPSAGLLALHASVQHAVGDALGRSDVLLPDVWTPHVTLARRLDADQLAAALQVLGDSPRELAGTVRAVRRWDGDARRSWDVPLTA